MQSYLQLKVCLNCVKALKTKRAHILTPQVRSFSSDIINLPTAAKLASNEGKAPNSKRLKLNPKKYSTLLKRLELEEQLSKDTLENQESKLKQAVRSHGVQNLNLQSSTKAHLSIDGLSSPLSKFDLNETLTNENIHEIGFEFDADNFGYLEEMKPNMASIKGQNTDKTALPKGKIKTFDVEKLRLRKLSEKSRKQSLRTSLKSYIHVCISSNNIMEAQSALLFHRTKFWKGKGQFGITAEPVIDISVYNVLLKGWAGLGKLSKVKEVFNLIHNADVEPDLRSYAYYIHAMAVEKALDKKKTSGSYVWKNLKAILRKMELQGFKPDQIFNKVSLNSKEKDAIVEIVRELRQDYEPTPPKFPTGYENSLLKGFENISQTPFSPAENIDLSEILSLAQEQLKHEVEGSVSIESVAQELNPEDTKHSDLVRDRIEKAETEWKSILKESFTRHLSTLKEQCHSLGGMNFYPYLSCMDADSYVEVMMNEIRSRATSSEHYSPCMHFLHRDLGRKVMQRYLIKARIDDGSAQDTVQLYESYLKYFENPQLVEQYSPREYWQKLMKDNRFYCKSEINEKIWPHYVQLGIGGFFYDMLLRDIQIDINESNSNKNRKLIPAFYTTYVRSGEHEERWKRELRANHELVKLYDNGTKSKLTFDVGEMPMLSPPLPWITTQLGGYILTKTDFVRMPDVTSHQNYLIRKTPVQKMYPCFDSLNALSLCPWKVNNRDVALHMFNSEYNPALEIPIPKSQYKPFPKISMSMDGMEKHKLIRERQQQKREQSEMYSLWCTCLYRLSIANYLRDKNFWLPSNLDFRGRCYPVPPNFSHVGSDLYRGLMLFARGQPLGPKGLDWLKIHVVNLTGLKKREPIDIRLRYAEEIMPLILDSADNPLNGGKWWQKSEEPWQTLACCIEIAAAIRSANPVDFVSYFPVHQDESCNGLQHYAALGRDQHGAESVNLHPSEKPQDVYSVVANLVEKDRHHDADSNPIAELLKGHINRKVVKQTVMTYVYGVTRFGAKIQILKRLKENDAIPDNKKWAASIYLTSQTFRAIQEMFTATKNIQDWLTESATVISRYCNMPVEWVTPLGFPIIQPYHKPKLVKGDAHFHGWIGKDDQTYTTYNDIMQKPNSIRQKNAFPPNFIHSLDSSHMMLTSLYCHKFGLTFASVHDCYWTHPNSVELMNRFCREQFVALHSEPLLENLSKHLVEKYKHKADDRTLKILSKNIKLGDFDLKNVLKSVYFFS